MRTFAVSKRYLDTRANLESIETIAELALGVLPERLTPPEKKFARVAWAFFKRNTNKQTGFCPTNGHSAPIGPAQMGATLLAILCAGNIGAVPKGEAYDLLDLCLQSISGMSLTNNKLPGLRYCARTMRPLGENGAPIEQAAGCSARAVLRLVSGFIAVAHHYPDLAPEISMILNAWDLDRLMKNGALVDDMNAHATQSARGSFEAIGYEQYAARAADLVGLPCQHALDVRRNLTGHRHGDLLLPVDRRQCRSNPCIITSEPFQLEALEFGWRREMLDVAASLFLAQKGRFAQSAHLTALSEIALDHAPHYAIQGIVAGKQPFVSLSINGEDLSKWQCLSTAAAFGWWALVPSPYSQKLLDAVGDLAHREGWRAGIYEVSGKINQALSLDTNAMVLEALHYKAFGPLFPANNLG